MLQAADGGAICGTSCDQVPVDGSGRYRTDLVVVPDTSGPVVPIAAIVTGADGRTFVTRDDGRDVLVRIVAAAHGRAVVDGVEPGETIRLSTDPGASSASPAPATSEDGGP